MVRARAQRKVQDFLDEILKDGPVPQKQIEDAAEQLGFTLKQLKTAKAKLGIASQKSGLGHWVVGAGAVAGCVWCGLTLKYKGPLQQGPLQRRAPSPLKGP